MANRSFLPFRGISTIRSLLLEKQLLEKNYNFLKVKIIDDTLYCNGTFCPCEMCAEYKYSLKFSIGKRPLVYIKSPDVKYTDDIHMYADSSLCLYYPKDFDFTRQSHLYNTIIPWTHEWFVFYELYLITGRWLHPYVEHRKID